VNRLFGDVDRRVAVAATAVALAAGALAVAVEAIVAHDARSTTRSHVETAADRATAFATDLRTAAARRAAAVTRAPFVQTAYIRRDAATLRAYARRHPDVEFTLWSGHTTGSIADDAVIQRLDVIGPDGRVGSVAAGVVPTTAQLARLQQASPDVHVAYVSGGTVVWPAGGRRTAGSILADVSLPTVAPSTLVISARASGVPVESLWPPLVAILAGLASSRLLATRRQQQVRTREIAKSLDIVGETLAATHDPQALLPVVLKAATEATGATGGVILTSDVPRVSWGITNASRSEQLDVPLRTEAGTVSTLRLFSGAEPFDDEARDAARWIATQAEIALENAHLHRLVQQQALTDELTSLANRRRFMAEFRREAQRADRTETPLSVIVIDIDDFKHVNDTWGHETGDLVLVGLAEVLAGATRTVDLAARLGGEEFAVLLPNTDAEGARGVAERVQRDLAEMTVDVPGDVVTITASFGISSFPEGAALAELLNDADRCLYEAKRAGKNRIVVTAARAR
jgi:diguanylate cyclase (GGDEF)-like protein